MSAVVSWNSPTPQEPATTRASLPVSGRPKACLARVRSVAVAGRNRVPTSGAATATSPAPRARARKRAWLFWAMCRSAPRWTHSRCTEGSVRYTAIGAATAVRVRGAERAWVASG